MKVPWRSLSGKNRQAAGWLGLGALVCLTERLDSTLLAVGSTGPSKGRKRRPVCHEVPLSMYLE